MAVNWDFEQTQFHIDEVASGQRFVYIETYKEHVLLTYPTKYEQRLADLQLEKGLHQAKLDKFPTEEEMMEEIINRGIWTEEDQRRVDQFKIQIGIRRKKILDPDIDPERIPYLQEAVDKLEEDIFKIEIKKERMLQHTAERVSRQSKYDWLTWCIVKDPFTQERLWSNYLTYYQLADKEVKSELLSSTLRFLSGHTTEEIRFLARSNLWRVNYLSATTTNSSLFGKPVTDLTPDQLNLAWWSKYYQSIYEMLPEDQPDDRTIDNDEELDKYMEDLHKERHKDKIAAKEGKARGGHSAMNHDTVLVFRSNDNYMDFEYDNPTDQLRKKDAVDSSTGDDLRAVGRLRKIAQGKAKIKRYRQDG